MIAAGLVTCALGILLFLTFGLGIKDSLIPALVAGVVWSSPSLLRPVAARAIATIGTNPISGMTMLTLVITGGLMLKLNFTGYGMFLTMMVGGIVCTALAASGAFSTDLKIGHWIGATPARQIAWKFVGTFVAALFTGLAMWLLASRSCRTAPTPYILQLLCYKPAATTGGTAMDANHGITALGRASTNNDN